MAGSAPPRIRREHLTEHPNSPTGACPANVKDLGGCITTSAHCLQLYGLYADDGLDPDEISYGDAGTSQTKTKRPTTQRSQPTSESATAVAEAFSGEVVVDPPADDSKRDLTPEEVELCKEIIKDPKQGAEWKADFIKRFYPEHKGLKVSMLKRKEHLDFLTLLRSGVPF